MLDKVKSKYILKEIFEPIKNKRKLNIIKYNKKIKDKLNLNKEDFETYITLKEFNIKYNTNIEDIDIKELNLCKRDIKDEGLVDLVKINFKNLNKLDLSFNEIYEIDILENLDFKELKELNLSYNYISDIDILEKLDFKKLNKLNLGCNGIRYIDVLEKVDFKELKELNLEWNEISDINVLKKVDFKKLNELDLTNNEINEDDKNFFLISLKPKINIKI